MEPIIVVTRYGHRGSRGPQPHENFEAMRMLDQYAWTEKVLLHKNWDVK